MSASNRNGKVELFRCLLMYGIVLLHCVHRFPQIGYWVEQMLLPCVCGFVFITGWFGIRFSLSKIFKIYGVQAYCVLAAAFIDGRIAQADFQWTTILTGEYWFGHAYVVLMLLSPLVNSIVERLVQACSREKALRLCGEIVPLLVLVFVWGFLTRAPFVYRIVPRTDGLDMYSGLTLLGVYAGARICRCVRVDQWIPLWIVLPAFLCLAAVVGVLRLGMYNSPFAFAVSMLAFVLFCHMPKRVERILGWVVAVSPSVFSVYFIHMGSRVIGLDRMVETTKRLAEFMPLFAACLCAALGCFVVSIAVDLPRRLAMRVFRDPLARVCLWVDNHYSLAVEWFGRVIWSRMSKRI